MTNASGTAEAHAVIAALRSAHDRLAAFVASAGPGDLNHQSMATEWSVARVLSHLGSGAEIGYATVSGEAVDNNEVWGRWNAMTPAEMATSYVGADQRLVAWYEARSDDELVNREIQLAFLPQPVPLAAAAGFRLSEVALHSWDVFASFNRTEGVAADAAGPLIDRLPAMAALLGRFIARETRPSGTTTIAVNTTDPERHLELELGDGIELRPASGRSTAGELRLPTEAFLRLVAGRLRHGLEAGATATGALSLDDLRKAFPGY
jgi:uncharacterized protein (TIGR03083 family)